VPQDYVEAARWYRMAADQGEAGAQFILGTMYEMGRGVRQDHGEAVRLWRKAAEQGLVFAQLDLGQLYESGWGVQQDYVLAHMWFNLSAAQGNQEAAKRRDDLATQMTPAQIAKAQQLAREWKPKASR
jgi:uncharacterized protein